MRKYISINEKVWKSMEKTKWNWTTNVAKVRDWGERAIAVCDSHEPWNILIFFMKYTSQSRLIRRIRTIQTCSSLNKIHTSDTRETIMTAIILSVQHCVANQDTKGHNWYCHIFVRMLASHTTSFDLIMKRSIISISAEECTTRILLTGMLLFLLLFAFLCALCCDYRWCWLLTAAKSKRHRTIQHHTYNVPGSQGQHHRSPPPIQCNSCK